MQGVDCMVLIQKMENSAKKSINCLRLKNI
jgi:hypothetical protein